jgi:tetrahydromethanopterin S-methyltransferase subunit G
MNKYIEYYQTLKSKISRTTLIFIGVVILVLLLLQQCNSNASLKREIKQVQMVADRELNNYKAGQDTIRIERNKNGELVAKKLAYVFDINSLTDSNKKAIADYQRALNLTKDIKNINSLLRTEIRIKDSIINSKGTVVSLTDSTSTINFDDTKNWDKYNWRRFNATVDVLRNKKTNTLSVTSSRFNFEQGIELKAAILNENGVNSLKITTPYPGIEFTNIENINLVNDKLNQKNEKKAGFSIGIGAGYGINLTPNSVITVGPQIGIGLYWSPKWLRF